VHQCLLGLRRGRSQLGIDPVVPKVLDGLVADVTIDGRPVQVRYRVAALGRGPRAIALNGHALPLTRVANPYRTGGVRVPMSALRQHLREGANELVVELE